MSRVGNIALFTFVGWSVNALIFKFTGYNPIYCTLGVAWMHVAVSFGIFMLMVGFVFHGLIPIALLALGSTVLVPVLIGMGATCQ